MRNGQWVRFELRDDVPLQLVVVDGPKKVTVIDPKHIDPLEVEVLKKRMQQSADGRFVGIYMGPARTPLGTNDEDGQPQYAHLPACVVPQRQILGPTGEQNLEFAYAGKAATVMLKADSVRNLEALMLREDIPGHRNETCPADWNPRR